MIKTDQNSVKPTADSLASAAQGFAARGPAPVHLWNPEYCGDLDMRIAHDGTWFYLGTPIGRLPLVKLFSSILKREGDGYFLVTPVEKVGIKVDDVPFIAVDFEVEAGPVISFTTNVGDVFKLDATHPMRIETNPDTGEPTPYVRVRSNLDARIDRKSFYRLVELAQTAEHKDATWIGVRSKGMFFPFIHQDSLGNPV
ncbi:MAG: DUF1285 domain-containing protein [Rhodobacteraceae bacterium]|nr:DUF1285 domain-containing protein [Paracoccaceae bacterium]